MIIEVIEVVSKRSMTEHDASIQAIVVFDSEWQEIFLVTQVMCLNYIIKICDKGETDVLVDFSEYLDTISPTL